MQGQFDAANNVSGTFRRYGTFTTSSGTRLMCDTGTVPFSGSHE